MDYFCTEECFHVGKRFKVGDLFPPEWIERGTKEIQPNKHFRQMTSEQAKQIAKMQHEELKRKAPQSAGEDRRSTIELKTALQKHIKQVPESWSRKQIWLKLFEYEQAAAKSMTKEA